MKILKYFSWSVHGSCKETFEIQSSGMEGSLSVQPYSPPDSWGKKKVKFLRDEDRVRVTAEKWIRYQGALLDSFPV